MNPELLIQRTLELALAGQGRVAPNPLVGAVIVRDGRIIAEGFHGKYGEMHAERMAISQVENPELLRGSELYVNLEPCSHHGKTPPCADLIIESGISKVFICHSDPNPLVNGKGIEKLKAAGIEVETGILEKSGLWLNRKFIINQTLKRPYITLKWAQSADGFMGRENENVRISNRESEYLTHKWRAQHDAILAGWKTVEVDNPALNVRLWSGKNPLRVILDRHGKLGANFKVFTDNQPTLVYTLVDYPLAVPNVKLPADVDFLPAVLQDLFEKKIGSIFVEGGRQIHQAFIEANLWNEAQVFVGNQHLTHGIPAPKFASEPDSIESLDDNQILRFYPTK